MTAALQQADRVRLVKLLGMLGSEHAGERAAAALAAHRFILRHEITWEHALFPMPPERRVPAPATWRETCARLLFNARDLTPWERRFCQDLQRLSAISQKQRGLLSEMSVRVLGAAL